MMGRVNESVCDLLQRKRCGMLVMDACDTEWAWEARGVTYWPGRGVTCWRGHVVWMLR